MATSVETRGDGGDATETRAEVVSASHVIRRYGEGDASVTALNDVSIDFRRRSFTAIMGPSGSGKSTLMHILAGLDRPTTGNVSIDGADITHMGDKALTLLRRKKIGFIFQSFNLLPMLTAEENITLPLRIGGRKPDKAFLDDVIGTMGLAERRRHRPAELSGGQQQRVAIARALVSKPAVVFADEPTGNLDSTTSHEVLQIMRRAVDDLGQTIIMVTHDAHAASVADRIVLLVDGHVVRDRGHSTIDESLELFKEVV
jgi:putative ABC transport system ATP-binding protein